MAERVLEVTERILQEASSSTAVLARTTSQEAPPQPFDVATPTGVEGGGAGEEDNQLRVLLKHIESPFVQSNPPVRKGLMHIIPFLTFGDPQNMNILLQHFAPYLDFEK